MEVAETGDAAPRRQAAAAHEHRERPATSVIDGTIKLAGRRAA
jgi:hypothetical protein